MRFASSSLDPVKFSASAWINQAAKEAKAYGEDVIDLGFDTLAHIIEAAIAPKPRWIMLNLPSSPAGAVYSNDDLCALGRALEKHLHVLILLGEIYEHTLFDGRKFLSFAPANPSLKDRTLTVNDVSKVYAMTGWRIGFGAGPKPLYAAMTKAQSQICCACSIAQVTCAAALNNPQDNVRAFSQAFEERHDLGVRRVAQIDGVMIDAPDLVFYGLIGCSGLVGTQTQDDEILSDDVEIPANILKDTAIAAVPRQRLWPAAFFRITTAASLDVLDHAMDCIATSVAKLERKT